MWRPVVGVVFCTFVLITVANSADRNKRQIFPARSVGHHSSGFRPIVFNAHSFENAPNFEHAQNFEQQGSFSFEHEQPERHHLLGNHISQQPPCECVHLIACSFHIKKDLNGCSLKDGSAGVCCPLSATKNRNPPWEVKGRLFESPKPNVQIRNLSTSELNQACQKGIRKVRSIKEIERSLQNTHFLRKGNPARGHQKFFHVTRSAKSIHQGALTISEASRNMARDYNLNYDQSCIGLRKFSARNTILHGNCPAPPHCKKAAKYRTLDGSCNNLRHPLWGKSETALTRILPARYDDGLRSPRTKSKYGYPLPSERRISHHVLVDFDNPDQKFTLSVMQWGQFIDHDMAHTPFDSFENLEGKECCENGQIGIQRLEDCWPIEIPPDDAFYADKGQRCMNFVRTMLAEDEECGFGCAEQMNQVTHWLDGSNIYGSTVAEAQALRIQGTGILKTTGDPAFPTLPYESEKSHDCEAARNRPCYAAGDSRVNEQPGLIAIHTIWHREHNRIASYLSHINPYWTGDAVYQEARRIVIAEYQHIIYNEWLPIIVGYPFMKSFDIQTKGRDYNFGYSDEINPNMYNEFTTGAFRFGHTLVQGTMKLFSRFGRGEIRLKDHFNNPDLFQRDHNMVDSFAEMLSKQSIQSFDSFITKDLTNHLFETPETNFGMDLMSLNIHRGRDHGIATYNDIREVCGLPRAKSFYDLQDQIPLPTIHRLVDVYSDVDDIDYFVGGISERPVAGGLLGHTFLCVVGDQFARVKLGDRYFYDIGGQPNSFHPGQLEEIRKVSWARILCDNTKNKYVQPLAFKLPDEHKNPIVRCDHPSIPHLNLNYWKNEKVSIFK